MSSDAPAVSVRNVSKRYRLYDRDRDRLVEWLSGGRVKRHRDFWVLRDVSLEVWPGDSVQLAAPVAVPCPEDVLRVDLDVTGQQQGSADCEKQHQLGQVAALGGGASGRPFGARDHST